MVNEEYGAWCDKRNAKSVLGWITSCKRDTEKEHDVNITNTIASQSRYIEEIQISAVPYMYSCIIYLHIFYALYDKKLKIQILLKSGRDVVTIIPNWKRPWPR